MPGEREGSGSTGRAPGSGGADLGGRPAGRADAVIGLLLLALSGAVFWLTRGLPHSLLVPLPPAFFPRLVAGVLAGLAVVLVVRGLRAGAREPGRAAAAQAPVGPALPVFGSLAGYIAVIPALGFFASTFVFLVVLGWLLEERRRASLPRAVVVAAVTTVITYLVFTKYLQVLFPEGLLR